MEDGKTFRIKNKVYIFTKTLVGYDDFYANTELNRLISCGLVKKLSCVDKYLDNHEYLPQCPNSSYSFKTSW